MVLGVKNEENKSSKKANHTKTLIQVEKFSFPFLDFDQNNSLIEKKNLFPVYVTVSGSLAKPDWRQSNDKTVLSCPVNFIWLSP